MIPSKKNSREQSSRRSGKSTRVGSSLNGKKRERFDRESRGGSSSNESFRVEKSSELSKKATKSRPTTSRSSSSRAAQSSWSKPSTSSTRSASGRKRSSSQEGQRSTLKKRLRSTKTLRKLSGSVFSESQENFVSKKTKAASSFVDERELGHRLQKVLAAAGFGSRRQCEELITTGRVDIDGQIVTELGVRVFPQRQKIRVDGEMLPKMKPVYLAINKPKGVLCTNHDQQGRRLVIDLIPNAYGRLFSVGRLDQESEGLLIMTNDGALAERLTHPRFEVSKKYRVQVAGLVDQDLVRNLKKGIYLAEGVVQADDVVIKSRYKQSSVLEIVLKEGKNREIRRMLARIGHKVMHLQRVAVGPVKLGYLLPGEVRLLTRLEVAQLYSAAKIQPQANEES